MVFEIFFAVEYSATVITLVCVDIQVVQGVVHQRGSGFGLENAKVSVKVFLVRVNSQFCEVFGDFAANDMGRLIVTSNLKVDSTYTVHLFVGLPAISLCRETSSAGTDGKTENLYVIRKSY